MKTSQAEEIVSYIERMIDKSKRGPNINEMITKHSDDDVDLSAELIRLLINYLP